MTWIAPCWPEFTVEPLVVRVIPPEVGAGLPSVTEVPEISLGCSVTVPPAGTMIVSGFKSHSAPGTLEVVPVITSKVAEYGANVIEEDHAFDVLATIVFGEPTASV